MRRLLLALLPALVMLGAWWAVRATRGPAPRGGTIGESSAPEPGGGVSPVPSNVVGASDRPVAAPAEAAGAAERRVPIVEGAPAFRSEPLRLRLVDKETGEAVPAYEVELSSPDGETLRATSDGDGRIVTQAEPAGRYRIRGIDCEWQESGRYVEHDGSEAEHEVALEIGPTYALEIAPAGLPESEFVATLFQDPPAFGFRPEPCGTTCVRAARQQGGSTWVRFATLEVFNTLVVLEDPAWLALSTRDGLRSGGARVPAGAGVHPGVIRIELEQRCAVLGRFVSRGDPHERGGGYLAVFLRGEERGEPRWEHTDGEGRFRIADLAPGAYRLEVRDEAVRADPVDFELTGGVLDLGELPWTPIPMAGGVRLRIQSDVEIPIDVELVRRLDPPHHPLWHSDAWEPLPAGGFESLFEWDQVYAGTYDVEVRSHDFEGRLALGELTPPSDQTLRLPEPRPAVALEVVDGASGAPLAEWSVLVRREWGWEELDDSERAVLPVAGWEDGAFAVSSPGFRALVTTPQAASAASAASGRFVARLRPGWSRLFIARLRSSWERVEGVEILLDGALAGTTNARGELWVHADAPATRLGVSTPRWTWVEESDAPLGESPVWIVLRP